MLCLVSAVWKTASKRNVAFCICGLQFVLQAKISINRSTKSSFNVDGHRCHRHIGVYMKHTVSDGKNLVNDNYELS